LIGFNQGLLVAAKRSLQSGELRENILPSIGSAAADLLAAIYVVAPELTKNESNWTQSTENLDAQLKAFQQGEWKLDINELIRRLKSSKTKVLQEIISMMDRSLKKDYPLLNEGIGEKIYTWFTNHFAESVIEGTIKGELESDGSLNWIEAGFAGLNETGASDQKVSHHDLSIVIAAALIDKGIIGPLRSAVRLQQIILLVTLLVLFVGPALTIRIADFAISRTQSKQA